MAVIVSCPSCKANYRLDPSKLKAGRGRLRCARCGVVFPIQATSASKGEPALPKAARGSEASRAETPVPAAPRRRATTDAQGPRLDVALVGSEPGEARRRIVSLLAHCRVRTVTVDDGPACLEVALRSRPRLLVLHAWMRGMLGSEVAELVRADPHLARAAIVLVGVPPAAGRYRADPARIHAVDACLPEDASHDEMEALFRSLLELPGGASRAPDPVEVRSFVAAVLDDLFLYHADAIDAGLRLKQPVAGIRRQIEDARMACVERFPAPPSVQPQVLAVLDVELEKALTRRSAALSLR